MQYIEGPLHDYTNVYLKKCLGVKQIFEVFPTPNVLCCLPQPYQKTPVGIQAFRLDYECKYTIFILKSGVAQIMLQAPMSIISQNKSEMNNRGLFNIKYSDRPISK